MQTMPCGKWPVAKISAKLFEILNGADSLHLERYTRKLFQRAAVVILENLSKVSNVVGLVFRCSSSARLRSSSARSSVSRSCSRRAKSHSRLEDILCRYDNVKKRLFWNQLTEPLSIAEATCTCERQLVTCTQFEAPTTCTKDRKHALARCTASPFTAQILA
jgi:hypothetical protein